ncbi:MAG: hypothetical protein O3A55_00100 [Bacteroidetes bacterium]|nr:hypothetical protein [Bacteroidota bacterium]
MYSQKIYTSSGWISSLIIHIILIWLMLITPFDLNYNIQETMELSWGPVNESLINQNIPLMEESSGKSGKAQKEIQASNIISLPKRNFSFNEDEKIKTLPNSKKESSELNPINSSRKDISTTDDEFTPIGISKSKTKAEGESENIGTSGIISTPYKGGVSSKNAAEVGYNIEWSGNIKRAIYNKVIPKFPEKVSQQAQIKIILTVAPDGTVKFAKPVQKGNPNLEQTSINALQFWVFEPLQSSFPQKDQTCIVTFNFVLK